MAGHNNGKGIGRQGHSNSAGTVRVVQVFRSELVRADSTTGNSVLGTQDSLLKGRAKVEADYIERELNILAVQACFNLTNKGPDLSTGGREGIGEEFFMACSAEIPGLDKRMRQIVRLASVGQPNRSHGSLLPVPCQRLIPQLFPLRQDQ